mmetsp:Transcript_10479/g.64122  ORF Transcript_10479/g.64122 Transcript_10479/m.64122 type:complete len:366 (+) Transcript_10479:1407-2504(+)
MHGHVHEHVHERHVVGHPQRARAWFVRLAWLPRDQPVVATVVPRHVRHVDAHHAHRPQHETRRSTSQPRHHLLRAQVRHTRGSGWWDRRCTDRGEAQRAQQGQARAPRRPHRHSHRLLHAKLPCVGRPPPASVRVRASEWTPRRRQGVRLRPHRARTRRRADVKWKGWNPTRIPTPWDPSSSGRMEEVAHEAREGVAKTPSSAWRRVQAKVRWRWCASPDETRSTWAHGCFVAVREATHVVPARRIGCRRAIACTTDTWWTNVDVWWTKRCCWPCTRPGPTREKTWWKCTDTAAACAHSGCSVVRSMPARGWRNQENSPCAQCSTDASTSRKPKASTVWSTHERHVQPTPLWLVCAEMRPCTSER